MIPSQDYNVATVYKQGEHYRSGKSLMKQFELLRKNPSLEIESDTERAIFFTIDDLLGLATRLVEGLNKLGEQKHPLSVRRGVKNVVERENKGEILKAKSKTYFFDIKETKEGKPYLVITESRMKGKDQKPERSSILVFQENMSEFAELVTKIAENFTQGN